MSAAKIVDQPLPVENDRPAIADLVIADIAERKRLGIERYGVALQPHNGRDALVDLYQEMLDGAKYIRQEIEERKDHRAEGAAAEREKIVEFMRQRARELDADEAETAYDLSQAIESGMHHDTWPALLRGNPRTPTPTTRRTRFETSTPTTHQIPCAISTTTSTTPP